MEKEQPHLIRRSFEMLISERVQGPDDIKAALPFPPSDIEEIADLEPGTLSNDNQARIEPVLRRETTDYKVISLSDHRRR